MYRWVDHTSEVELEIEAADAAAVFEDALAAVAELVSPEPAQGEPLERALDVTATDRAVLLADWLTELVYLAESEGFVPERVRGIELDGTSIRATVVGRLGQPRHLVKAVTYHRLEFTERDRACHARVVFDV